MRLYELAGRMRCTLTGLKFRHVYRWAMMALLALAYTSGTAMAQLPFMFVDDAGVFEGNSGTTILKLPVRFVGTQNLTVTGAVSAIPLQARVLIHRSGAQRAARVWTCSHSVTFRFLSRQTRQTEPSASTSPFAEMPRLSPTSRSSSSYQMLSVRIALSRAPVTGSVRLSMTTVRRESQSTTSTSAR